MANGYPHSLVAQIPIPPGTVLELSTGNFQVSSTGAGAGTLTSLRVNANRQLGTNPVNPTLPLPLPPGAYIDSISFREISNTAGVTVNVGTTALGSDVVSSQAVAQGAGAYAVSVSTPTFSANGQLVAQALFVNSASWGTAVLNIEISYCLGP